MSHMVRAALLLVLFLTGLLFVRSVSTKVSIEFIGLSRADNPSLWATRPVQNQSSATCAECHAARDISRQMSAHASVRCENCHGPAKAHAEDPNNPANAPLVLADSRSLCLTCHAKLASRPADFPQVDPTTHSTVLEGTTLSCASCHNPHNPGIPPPIPHTLEGRSDCLICHGADKWKPLPAYLVDKAVAPDDCLKCHNPKEGE